MNELNKTHLEQISNIKSKINEFKNKREHEQYLEFLFCILTPQSNAKTCWDAVLEMEKTKAKKPMEIEEILRGRSRFHKTKANRIIKARKIWEKIKKQLYLDPIKLREFLVKEVNGYGLKEASHFIRNIGKSYNKIAIIDRHILNQMILHNKIKDKKIKNKKDYLEIENKFISWSKELDIPVDELDMVLWYNTHKEIFK